MIFNVFKTENKIFWKIKMYVFCYLIINLINEYLCYVRLGNENIILRKNIYLVRLKF